MLPIGFSIYQKDLKKEVKTRMSQKNNKAKTGKDQPWNSFAYPASLARKKESVIIHLNTNTIEDESQLKGVIIDLDNWTLAFLTNNGRELLLFKHAIRLIKKLRGK